VLTSAIERGHVDAGAALAHKAPEPTVRRRPPVGREPVAKLGPRAR
jgi:hypothetical protein